MKQDTSPLLSAADTKYIQQVVGTFLYYGRALDYTMLSAINTIATQQAMPTQLTMQRAQQLLDYAYTYAKVFVRFYASDMQLEVDSDAAFLVLPNSKSRIDGYFRLLHHQNSPHCCHVDNGPILVEVLTVKSVLTSAAEAETHGVFHNAKLVLPLVHMLKEMGHPQRHPPRIRTDNSTSCGFANNNIVLKRSKFWDLKLHWLRDKQSHTFFSVFWDKGNNNGADYFTKHHPTFHHRHIRKERKYVRDFPTES